VFKPLYRRIYEQFNSTIGRIWVTLSQWYCLAPWLLCYQVWALCGMSFSFRCVYCVVFLVVVPIMQDYSVESFFNERDLLILLGGGGMDLLSCKLDFFVCLVWIIPFSIATVRHMSHYFWYWLARYSPRTAVWSLLVLVRLRLQDFFCRRN